MIRIALNGPLRKLGLVALVAGVCSSRAVVVAQSQAPDPPPIYLDDASRMDRTRVAEVWPVPDRQEAAESQLRELLARARDKHLAISIAGARHSMGGHVIAPDGIVIDMLPFNRLELSADRLVLHAQAGARWSQIVPFLDSRGLSVAEMQSNNDFTVGGSLSVDCHGWPVKHAPIASSVRSLRLMKADGAIVRCGREENAELFSLVLGGYGLFGIILDADLYVVANERYRTEAEVLPVSRFTRRFDERLAQSPDIAMAYGRLCIVPGENFLREAILTVFHRSECRPEQIPPLKPFGNEDLRRQVYRGQIGSQSGKEIRWQAEKKSGEQTKGAYYSRNQLLNEPSSEYAEDSQDRVDLLQEYFLSPGQFEAFVDRARTIIPECRGDLLNVTVRSVSTDRDVFLRYADRDMLSLVMSFSQNRSDEADKDMQRLTQQLIDAALACGGRYYLPYRLHATREQFFRAYPQATRFFELKRRYDPNELFQNQLYVKYGRP